MKERRRCSDASTAQAIQGVLIFILSVLASFLYFSGGDAKGREESKLLPASGLTLLSTSPHLCIILTFAAQQSSASSKKRSGESSVNDSVRFFVLTNRLLRMKVEARSEVDTELIARMTIYNQQSRNCLLFLLLNHWKHHKRVDDHSDHGQS